METRLSLWQYRLILLTLLILSSFSASASYVYYDFCLDGIYYSYYQEELEVVKVDAGLKDVVIPSRILFNGDYRPVTKISTDAFNENTVITSVTIPETIVLIERSAFGSCKHLNSVYITDLSSWCNIKFENSISNPLSLAKHLFLDGEEIIDLRIPDSVTSIGDYAFSELKGLKSVTIHDSVVTIGKEAFSGCVDLSSVSIGNSVTSIGKEAFSGCVDLSSVSIGNSVTSIPSGCFAFCKSLTSVTIPNTISKIYDYAFAGCDSMTSLTIPASVTAIYDGAFNCKGIKELIIEDSPKSLWLSVCNSWDDFVDFTDRGLFHYCPIETLYLGRNLEYPAGSRPGESTAANPSTSPFYNQVNLSNLTISHFVTSIGKFAFGNCSNLTTMTIPNSITEIEEGAFDGCKGIKELIIEDGGNRISLEDTYKREGLFHDCPLEKLYYGRNRAYSDIINQRESPFLNQLNLRSIVIGDSVIEIEKSLFNGCSGLTSLTIGHNVSEIGIQAFEDCSSLASVTLPPSVTRIREGAFSGCSSLASVTMPPSVTYIEGEAFSGCSSLASMTIPPSVTYIGEGAFSGCSSLASVTLPPSVTRIERKTFSGCSSLTSMTIPPSVTYIEGEAFSGSSVKELVIEDGTEKLSIEEDLCCPLEILYLGRDIDDSKYEYQRVDPSPFENSPKLKRLTIGNGVTKIRQFAFSGCSSLTSVIISPSVTYIGEKAFSGCSSLTSMIIGESVTSIGERAFEGCSSLCSLTIPKSVARIEAWAFEGCSGLKELVIEDGIETLSLGSDFLFEDCPLETLYLGRNLPLNFMASPFSGVQNPMVVSIGKPVTSVDKYLFEFRNIKSIAFYSFNIKGIANCGLDSDTPVTLCTKSDFSGIGNTNLTYFKKITVIKDSNRYGLVRSKVNLNFSKYLYAEGDLYIMPLETCHASWTDTAIKTVFRGEEITDILNNPNGFDFIPSEYHYDNYFGVYGSPDNPSLVKVIELESAGSLLNELELNDLDRIEALIIKGNVDGTDIMTINRMSNLKYLDISNANIVAGGETYRDNLKTENDVIGTRFFDDINLELLYLPNSAKTISDMAFYDMPFYYGAELCSGDLRCIRLGNSINTIGNMAFWGCSGLSSVNVPKTVVAIGSDAFLDCTRLTAVNIDDLESWCKIDFQDSNANPLSYAHHLFLNGEEVHDLIIPSSIVNIKDNAFVGCSGLTSLSIPNTVISIGDNAFCGSSISEVILPESIIKIGRRALASNTNITKVISLNPTPPEIDPRTFDSKVLESATLYVPRGSLMLYFIDPVWKEFKNISDDVLCLQAIPNAKYGDGEIDLSQYAPEGVALTYQSSNEDVVRINGSSMQIVGAGEATVAAILDEDGTTTELVGQLRSIVVDKADLTVSVEEIVIEEGSPIPDFTYIAEGLQYDDTLEDIDNLPQPIHDVDENSPKGEYMVSFTEGSDRNYHISTKPSKITVTERSSVEDNLSDDEDRDVEIYDLNGLRIYHGVRNGVILGKGIYIVRQGDTMKKIIVK